MSYKIECTVKSTVIAWRSPLLRLKHELGATMKMCIVRSRFLKILHCAGVLVESRDGVDHVWILTAGSKLYNNSM